MRVLLTGLPVRSHLVPVLVPLAHALRRAGHTVAIATGPGVSLDVPVLELPFVPSPGRMHFGWRPEVTGQLPVPVYVPAFTSAFVDDLLPLARSWRPDVIVRETNEYGGALVASSLDIPHAVVEIAPLMPPPPLDVPAPVLRAGLLPPAWYSDSLARECFRVDAPPRSSGDPLVLASFGSNFASLVDPSSRLVHIVVEALGSLPFRAVVVGTGVSRLPPNVVLASSVPQEDLLGSCAAFVTHAGFSGVRESLSAGVPMVTTPLFADQPFNSARVVSLGLGVEVAAAGLTSDVLASAVLQAVARGDHAMEFRRAILELPDLDALVDHLSSVGTA